MLHVVETQVPPDPREVGLFGSDGVVTHPELGACAVEELRLLAIRAGGGGGGDLHRA